MAILELLGGYMDIGSELYYVLQGIKVFAAKHRGGCLQIVIFVG